MPVCRASSRRARRSGPGKADRSIAGGKAKAGCGSKAFWYLFGVGEVTTHFRLYFGGDWDVHGITGLVTDPWPSDLPCRSLDLSQEDKARASQRKSWREHAPGRARCSRSHHRIRQFTRHSLQCFWVCCFVNGFLGPSKKMGLPSKKDTQLKTPIWMFTGG